MIGESAVFRSVFGRKIEKFCGKLPFSFLSLPPLTDSVSSWPAILSNSFCLLVGAVE
ncbi:hypothetical protein COLO4_37479 [Corchorus olitorius]|uniref:Uncharacterized protein n=1 Tax=Corchorus olitorius TaxID=93759 RepID=A0A1R3G1F1_9ROSI|nr:hypothetical protein COLO4_37479 [Corchorus olitorius]